MNPADFIVTGILDYTSIPYLLFIHLTVRAHILVSINFQITSYHLILEYTNMGNMVRETIGLQLHTEAETCSKQEFKFLFYKIKLDKAGILLKKLRGA